MAFSDSDDKSADDSRVELYRRFRSSLSRPQSERFFDEDELVEIFDYAGDIDDFYARVEVLCCGARLYPDSRALADRRAMLYLDEDDSDHLAREWLVDNPGCTSALADIVALTVSHPSAEEAPIALDRLLDAHPKLDDEETIRLVDMAEELGCYNWLVSRLDRLRPMASYLPALLYEVLGVADNHGDTATAIALADELISIEPFSEAYWSALFRAHARAGNTAEAASAFDTAAALAADNTETIGWLADCVLTYAPSLAREALEAVDSAIAKEPTDFRLTELRCGLLVQTGRQEEALETLRTFLQRCPDNIDALRRLLASNAPDTAPFVEAIYKASPELMTPDNVSAIAATLHLGGAMRALVDFLVVVAHHSDGSEADIAETTDGDGNSKRLNVSFALLGPWIEGLFALGRYADVATLMGALPNPEVLPASPLSGAPVAAAAVIAWMKLEKEEEAKAFIAAVRPGFEAVLVAAPLAVRMTVRSLLSLFDAAGRHPASDRLFWQYHDPYGYGKFE